MTSRVIKLGVAQNNRDESQSRSGRVAVLSDANPPPLPPPLQRQADAFKRDCSKVSFVRELYFVIKEKGSTNREGSNKITCSL